MDLRQVRTGSARRINKAVTISSSLRMSVASFVSLPRMTAQKTQTIKPFKLTCYCRARRWDCLRHGSCLKSEGGRRNAQKHKNTQTQLWTRGQPKTVRSGADAAQVLPLHSSREKEKKNKEEEEEEKKRSHRGQRAQPDNIQPERLKVIVRAGDERQEKSCVDGGERCRDDDDDEDDAHTVRFLLSIGRTVRRSVKPAPDSSGCERITGRWRFPPCNPTRPGPHHASADFNDGFGCNERIVHNDWGGWGTQNGSIQLRFNQSLQKPPMSQLMWKDLWTVSSCNFVET